MRLKRVDGVFRGVMWGVDKDSLTAYLEVMDTLGEKHSHLGGINAALQAVGAEGQRGWGTRALSLFVCPGVKSVYALVAGHFK
jgi:hypothetical protein